VFGYHNQFPIITLPLMTTYAQHYNGCERVIVSQIIRSPGVYFEKKKTRKHENNLNENYLLT
jgi:DNA-directed RNA polymerase beta subunit